MKLGYQEKKQISQEVNKGQRVFIRDANGDIQGNIKGYATMRGAAGVFNKRDMQEKLINIGHDVMNKYLEKNPTYGGFNLIDIGGYGFEDVPNV